MIAHSGGCHCGAVRFEIDAPEDIDVLDCNCSICRLTGHLHLVLPPSRFRLIRGRGALTTYTFGTGIAKHTFCSHCGIKSFYIPRSNPDGYSVNARCLDPGTVRHMNVKPFDGWHWEDHAGELAHLSQE